MALALREACLQLAEADPEFRGSLQHASESMDRVGLQQLKNLAVGATNPWDVKVRTMHEILKLFKGCKAISPRDFRVPRSLPGTARSPSAS